MTAWNTLQGKEEERGVIAKARGERRETSGGGGDRRVFD